ncbi:MAG: uncharacterized protein QOJ00_2270 [Actinomycetota bacterium]
MPDRDPTEPFVAAPDDVTQPWWEATRDQRLVVQRCTACDHRQHYPRPLCLACGSNELEWLECSGDGVVHSFTIVRRELGAAFDTPHVVALVDLAEGPRLTTNLVGASVDAWECDEPVRLTWRALGDGRRLPLFTKAT